MPIQLAVSVWARPGKESALRASLEALVAPTRREAGCLLYDLHVDREDPAHFHFYEVWSDEAALEAHAASAHIAAHRLVAGDLVDRRAFYRLEKI